MAAEQRARPFLRRLAKPALAVCATLFALLLGEALVRVFGRAPEIKPIQLNAYDCIYRRSLNPILGFQSIPGQKKTTAEMLLLLFSVKLPMAPGRPVGRLILSLLSLWTL